MNVLKKEGNDYFIKVEPVKGQTRLYFDEEKFDLDLEPEGDLMHITCRPPIIEDETIYIDEKGVHQETDFDVDKYVIYLEDRNVYLYYLSEFAKFSRKIEPVMYGIDNFLDREFNLVLKHPGHGYYIPVFDMRMINKW